jgi:hypothetical protein
VTTNPAAPYEVVVSRPSDALAAKLATERASTDSSSASARSPC